MERKKKAKEEKKNQENMPLEQKQIGHQENIAGTSNVDGEMKGINNLGNKDKSLISTAKSVVNQNMEVLGEEDKESSGQEEV